MPVKKKRDRFNGMPEEEVIARGLPDHLAPNLDIVIVGINPGLMAAYVGHHYAGPGNHFWKCLYLSGLIPEPMTAYDDYKLMKCGIGFTNIVARTTKGSADLTRKEIKEGGEILIEKLREYKPKIAVFNGKGIYEVFCGHKNFYIGKQPEPLPGTDIVVYVMPSSSARCSQLPRAVDKVPFYASLKKLRDYLRGDVDTLDESEVCFPDLELKVKVKAEKQEPVDNGDNATQNNQSVPHGNFNNMPMVKAESGYDQQCFGMMPQHHPNNAHHMGMPPQNYQFPPQQNHFGQQGQHCMPGGKDGGPSCTELMPMRPIKQEPGQNYCNQTVRSVMSSEGSFPSVTSPLLYQMANMAPPYPYNFDQNPPPFSQAPSNASNTYPSSSQSCQPQNSAFLTFGQNSSQDGHYPGMPVAPAAVPGPPQPNQGYNHSSPSNEMGQAFVNLNQNYHPPQGSPQSSGYNATPPPPQGSPNANSMGHSPNRGRSPGPGGYMQNNMYTSGQASNPNGLQNAAENVGHSPRSQSPRYIGSPANSGNAAMGAGSYPPC
ncbi:G/T mismatch-specific thymine DNA glycosylase-like [Lineus longissimus]|uniref:G/T mismatch-specific thymine DNA glycosylase-like n=1 Tax=Lineus longissimus TaxID=88925 RepID=UPI00315CAE31